MNCPKCATQLSWGRIRLRGELWRQLTLWGMSWLRATFVGTDTPRQVEFLVPWQRRSAYACLECRMVVVLPRASRKRKTPPLRGAG